MFNYTCISSVSIRLHRTELRSLVSVHTADWHHHLALLPSSVQTERKLFVADRSRFRLQPDSHCTQI